MHLNAIIRKTVFLFALAVIGSTFAAAQPKKPAASGTQFRSITVSATPSAKVWIDGVYYGKTSAAGTLTIATVAAGAHTLRLRADGYKEKSLPLAATHRGEVAITLVKTTDEAELAFQEAERLAFVDREKAIETYRRGIDVSMAHGHPSMANEYKMTLDLDY